MVNFSFNSTLAQLMNVCMQFSCFSLEVQNLQIKIFAAYSHSLTH